MTDCLAVTTEVREVYLPAAGVAVTLISQPAVAARWSQASVLPGMSVGALAGHLALSVLQVEWFLDGAITGGPLTSAVTYYGRLQGTTVAGSSLNVGVRQRSESTAQQGPTTVAEEVRRVLNRLGDRLTHEPKGRRVAVLHPPGEEMLLEEYLKTRCVELAVHTEDLALSIDAAHRAPEEAVTIAVELLVAAAKQRHGDREVLHALTRRERDTFDSLRVL